MKGIKIKLHVFFLLLVGICGTILLAETISEERRLDILGASFSELYKDRLQAEEWVFQMNDLVHDKKSLLLSHGDVAGKNRELSKKLMTVYSEYAATKLSPSENVLNLELDKFMKRVQVLEQQPAADQKQLLHNYEQMLSLLERMSLIQLEEGVKLKNTGEQTVASSRLGVKLHSALTLVLLLSLLLLFKNTGLGNRLVQHHQLN